jgi:hypothetical protein
MGVGGEKQSSDAIIRTPPKQHEAYLNKPQAWSHSAGREHELPRAGISMRPELARSGWLDTMMGKSLRKIGRDRQHEQHKKPAYMGKEEVLERIWLVYRLV